MKHDDVHASRQLAGRVRRWHTWPVLHQQTVAEHSARVATLYAELFGLPRAEVLYYCLHHDSGEQFAGDVPYGAKRAVPGLPDLMNTAEAAGLARLGVILPRLTEQEWVRFKIADLMEMWEFATVEVAMGNDLCWPVVQVTMREASRMASEHGIIGDLDQWITRQEKGA